MEKETALVKSGFLLKWEIYQTQTMKLCQAKDVRWLSHDQATVALRKNFRSVLTSLQREAQERNDTQAMGLSVFLHKYQFIASLMMMSDVLPHMSALSKAMQKRDAIYTTVKPLVKGTISIISRLLTTPGEFFCSTRETIQNLTDEGFQLKMPTQAQEAEFMENVYKKFLQNIIDNLEGRFPDLPLIENFGAFDMTDCTEETIEEHGSNEIGLIKRWKIRWFTLEEDQLTCHNKKDRSLVIETIPLQGASVICPCYDEPDVNEETAFKLNTASGEELLFQAAGMQDRDRWAHAIGAVIRSISSASQVSNSPVKFQDFRVKANVSEVLGALQDPDAGVILSSHIRNGTVHKNCFKGSDVIQWLLRWNIVRKRNDGIAMAQSLLKLGHLQEVDLSDGTAGVMQFFKDDEKLYRFTSLNLGVQRNSYFDSSDSDSSLSEDEEDTKIEERVRKGKLVKAGYIFKKKSLRKGWRIVRLLIRDNPPSMQYECPYRDSLRDPKRDNKASKTINLQYCYLSESSGSATEMGDLKSCKVSPKLRIYIRTKGRKCHTFQAKDEEEWFDYVSLLKNLCCNKEGSDKPKQDSKAK